MLIAPEALDPGHAPDVGGTQPPGGPQWPQGGPIRRRPTRLLSMLLIAAIVAVAGTAGVALTARRQVDRIDRVDGLTFSAANDDIENFLLVGSDSREGADPSDPDFGAIGDAGDVTGNRSDTVMILRRDRDSGEASLLSLPRDLCIDLPDCNRPRRINAAFQDGPQALIDTITNTFGIPIHHYVEVDFQGFKELVEAVGGVKICTPFGLPIRDTHTGLYTPQGGCVTLDGVQGLAYARSRHLEVYDPATDAWNEDPSSDFGRIKRQQEFINLTLQTAVAKVKSNPLTAGDVMGSMTGALHIDEGLDVLAAANALRDAVGDGLQKYTVPVRGKTVQGNAMLVLSDGFEAYIDYFRGVTDTPPPTDGT